jgi:dihydrofolate reductase
MRKIIVSEFLTLDGVMQSPGGPQEDPKNNFKWGGWSFPFWDEVMNAKMAEITAQPYDLLLGRRTYDIFAAFWPNQKDDPTAETFNRIEKFVVTDNAIDLSWVNSTGISRNIIQQIKALKTQEGPDLLVYGSGNLIQTLFRHNLIDLLHIWIFPVSLGNGQRLFEEGTPAQEWKLSESATSTTGVVMSTYVPAGSVRTGTMQSS